MGIVYLAEREDLGSKAAIKILRDSALSPLRRQQFAIEQQVLARLNHPSIARFYDADTTEDGTPFIVMEYVEGLPLGVYVGITKYRLKTCLHSYDPFASQSSMHMRKPLSIVISNHPTFSSPGTVA